MPADDGGSVVAALKDDSGSLEDDESMSVEGKVSLNDFDLIRVIGKGSFGKVIQARKKDNGEVRSRDGCCVVLHVDGPSLLVD